MKKSLLALAVLGAFAGAASAQSSVTVYGKLDLAAAKAVGTEDKAIADNTGSRLGFKGTEDLGNGMKAVFQIEHRFNPDDGTAKFDKDVKDQFWRGLSTVGLVTPYGTVNLGRQYTAAFLVQNSIDPWGGDTVVNLRDIGVSPKGANKIVQQRVNNSVRYDYTVGAFAVAASIAETDGADGKKPYALAGTYTAGPLYLGLAYENPQDEDDKALTIGGTYNLGFAKLAASYTKGTTAADVDAKGFLIGATIPVGALDIKVGFAQGKLDDSNYNKLGLGAHYNLSKRTKVYADFAHVSGKALSAAEEDQKNGYDFGIQHNF